MPAGRAVKEGVLDVDFSGRVTRFVGLPQRVASRMRELWGPWIDDSGAASPWLRFEVRTGEPLRGAGPFRPKAMTRRVLAGGERFEMPEGNVEIGDDAVARCTLRPVDQQRDFYTVANLHRAALARGLPRDAGLLVHAAGVAIDGRAYALVGAHGAGKTTWAGIARDAGHTVISDDLLVIDGIGSAAGARVLGTPLRSTLVFPPCRGRWPLARILLPRHGVAPALAGVDRVVAAAALTANLPFVDGADAAVVATADRLLADVPTARLTFAPDDGFVALLRDDR